MEVVEGAMPAAGEPQGPGDKRIHLLVTTDPGSSERSVKATTAHTPSVFLYNTTGQLVPAEIMVDSLNKNMVAVPLREGGRARRERPTAAAATGPPTLRVLEVKKQRRRPMVAAPRSPAPAVTCPQPPTSPTSIFLTSSPQQARQAGQAGVLEAPVEASQDRPHPKMTEDVRLTVFSDAPHKPALHGVRGGAANQTVVVPVSSLEDLQMDHIFLTAEALEEVETEEVPPSSPTLPSNSVRSVTKTENLDLDELQMDLHSMSPGQLEMGSSNVNQSWFTSREDKQLLRWRGHAWRQGMWSREETELLQRNIDAYCARRNLRDAGSLIFKMTKEERSGFYREVAKGLNRPLFAVYRRVIRMYDNHNHIGRYTREEVDQLRRLRLKHGNNWQAIATHLGRSAASVKDRCRLLKENCNRGAWTPEEEDRLAQAVYQLAQVLPGEQVTSGISWGSVAGQVGTRSEKQCRTKWLNYLNWKRTSGVEWSKADDVQLICRLSVCGVSEESQVDWGALARVWPACRSPHWLRGKWWNLKRRLTNVTPECSLREMCQQLYNQQPMSLLQATVVELPATFLNNASSALASPHPSKVEEEGAGLSVGTVKLCIPATNFSLVINCDDGEEEFGAKLSRLVQTALLDTLPDGPQPGPTVTQAIQDSLTLQLADGEDAGLGRSPLLHQGKEEDLLSDGEGSHSQTGLTTTLDRPSPARVSSQVILNDPILSVSGEPLGGEEGLGTEGLQAAPTHLTCRELAED